MGTQCRKSKMASLAKVVRSGTGLIRSSSALVNAARPISFTAVQNKDYKMNDAIDHAPGLEKYDLLQEQAGNDDPFFMKAVARGKGTKEVYRSTSVIAFF